MEEALGADNLLNSSEQAIEAPAFVARIPL